MTKRAQYEQKYWDQDDMGVGVKPNGDRHKNKNNGD